MHGTSENVEGVGSLLVSFLRSASSLCVPADNSTCLGYHATFVRFACHQPLPIVDHFVRKRTKKCGKGIIAPNLALKRVINARGNTDERLLITTVRCKERRAYTLAMHRDYIIAGKEINRHAHRELIFSPKPSCKANQRSLNNRIATTAPDAKPFSRVFNHRGSCASHLAQFKGISCRSSTSVSPSVLNYCGCVKSVASGNRKPGSTCPPSRVS
jgi:hypothetical protein